MVMRVVVVYMMTVVVVVGAGAGAGVDVLGDHLLWLLCRPTLTGVSVIAVVATPSASMGSGSSIDIDRYIPDVF